MPCTTTTYTLTLGGNLFACRQKVLQESRLLNWQLFVINIGYYSCGFADRDTTMHSIPAFVFLRQDIFGKWSIKNDKHLLVNLRRSMLFCIYTEINQILILLN